jgi:hypothetical protein
MMRGIFGGKRQKNFPPSALSSGMGAAFEEEEESEVWMV